MGASVRADRFALLIACIVADIIGLMSYLLFIIGEVTDLWWAPMVGFFLQYMFGSMLVTAVGAIEEFLPFTDFIPTATIAWAISHLEALEFLRKLLGVRSGAQQPSLQPPQ